MRKGVQFATIQSLALSQHRELWVYVCVEELSSSSTLEQRRGRRRWAGCLPGPWLQGITHVKIPVGKRCGFVQYALRFTHFDPYLPLVCGCMFDVSMHVTVFYYCAFRSSAEELLVLLQGTLIGGQNVRLSWGRSPSNKQVQVIISCMLTRVSTSNQRKLIF